MPNLKSIDYYLALPYTIMLTPDEDGSWFARIQELPGCMTIGDTQQQALEMIEDAKLSWISASLEAGDPIPEPEKQTT